MRIKNCNEKRSLTFQSSQSTRLCRFSQPSLLNALKLRAHHASLLLFMCITELTLCGSWPHLICSADPFALCDLASSSRLPLIFSTNRFARPGLTSSSPNMLLATLSTQTTEQKIILRAKWRLCGERGPAKIVYTKLVHQQYYTFHEVLRSFLGFCCCQVSYWPAIPRNVHE